MIPLFRKNIRNSLQFSSDQANQMFRNISGDSFMGDSSFVATTRALLHHRIGKDQSVKLIIGSSHMGLDKVRSLSSSGFFEETIGSTSRSDAIVIHNIHGGAENIQAALDKFDELPSYSEEFVALPVLTAFFKQGMAVRFYRNERRRTTVIAIANMTLPMYHALQILIPKYIPWYFEGEENKLTSLELSLVKSLSKKEQDDYEAIMAEIASGIDFRGHMIKEILGGFAMRALEKNIRNIENKIEMNRNDIEHIIAQYNEKLAFIQDSSYKLLGLKATLESGSTNDELVDYFTVNKNLIPVSESRDGFSFIVNTYLDIVDPDMYATIADNEHSFLYEMETDRWTKEDIRKLFDAIFSEDSILRVKTCAFYSIHLDGAVDSESGYNYPPECNDRLPNPHLHLHNCLGNHRPVITELINRGDLTGAVMQCVSSARSMNICEHITSKRFLEDVLVTRAKVIELPDGSSATAAEALEWLKKQEQETKEENDGQAD